MVEEEDEQTTPLLTDIPSTSSPSLSSIVPNGPLKRTGTVWTAIAHVITGVIGSGVLSLAWSVAQLGWIAGPLCIVVFGIVTVISSNLLCDCYRSPYPEFGPIRNRSYAEAVKSYLGTKSMWACGVFAQICYFGYGIAYTITSAISMRIQGATITRFAILTASPMLRAIQRSNCFHKEGHEAPCEYGDSLYMLLFGAVQLVFSQIPNFHKMEWLSIVAAIMSFSYSSIGLALGFAKVIGNGKIKGGIGGVPTTTAIQKVWLVSQAVGDIAFAFTYNTILLEIEDTLKSPPPESQTMKKASMTAILLTTFFFLCCGCFGYAAFGNETPGNLLTGFGFYEPYWLIDFANACIVLHLVGGYQVYSQPLFAATERWITKKFPNNGFVSNIYTIKLPMLPVLELNLLRLCFRSAYVATTTGIAILFPYFNQVLGVLGAFNFWPLAIYFPVEMFILQRNVRAWTKMWVVLEIFSVVCLLVNVEAFVGSVEGVISNLLS